MLILWVWLPLAKIFVGPNPKNPTVCFGHNSSLSFLYIFLISSLMLFQHFFWPNSLLLFWRAIFFHTIVHSFCYYFCTLLAQSNATFPAHFTLHTFLPSFTLIFHTSLRSRYLFYLRCCFVLSAFFLLALVTTCFLPNSLVLFLHIPFLIIQLFFSTTVLPSSFLHFFHTFFPSSLLPFLLTSFKVRCHFLSYVAALKLCQFYGVFY